MAEIRVEPKNNNNNSYWLWIVAALVLAGVIWGVVELLDRDPVDAELAVVEAPVIEEEPVVNSVEAELSELAPVNEFVAYVNNETIAPNMGLDHRYTSEALQKLQMALAAIARDEDVLAENVYDDLVKLEEVANKIQTDPLSLQHANLIQEAFLVASGIMTSLQDEYYVDLSSQVADVRALADALNTDKPTLEQKDTVRSFFEESAEAVLAMANQ